MTAADKLATLIVANRAVAYGTAVRWLMHDLRNPAQTLSLVTELIGSADSAPDASLYAALRDSMAQLAVHIETLDRTVMRLPPPGPPTPIALTDVFAFLATILQSHRSQTQLALSPAIAESLPAVAGLTMALEHALLNLLLNAFEAVGDRSDGQIGVTAAVDGDEVLVTIDDNGPGVVSELRTRLFEPYASTKPRSPYPAGLGLTVARHLLESMGGTLTYQPKETAGARFEVRLRVWRSASA